MHLMKLIAPAPLRMIVADQDITCISGKGQATASPRTH